MPTTHDWVIRKDGVADKMRRTFLSKWKIAGLLWEAYTKEVSLRNTAAGVRFAIGLA